MLTNTVPKQYGTLLVQCNSLLLKIKMGYGDLECIASKAQRLSCEVNEGDTLRFDNTQCVQEGWVPT